MKLFIGRSPVFLLSAFLAFTPFSSAEIDFTGVFVTSKVSKFALADTTAGSSSWLAIGDNFNGYKIAEYNPEERVLTLKKGEEVIRLRLLNSQVKEGFFPLSGKITVGDGEAIIVSDAIFVIGLENTFPIGEGVVLRLKAERLPNGNLKYTSSSERTLPDGKRQWIQAPAMVGRPSHRVILQVDDYRFEFTPKDA